MKYFVLIGIFLFLIVLAHGQEVSVVYARDFGAIPNDGKDDAVALRSAVLAAKEKTPARVVLEKGVYDLIETDEHGAFVSFDNTQNLEFDGTGATLRTHKAAVVLRAVKSKEISLTGFEIERTQLPFAGAKITASRAGSFDCKIVEPYQIQEGARPQAIIAYDPKKGHMGAGFDVYQLDIDQPIKKLSKSTMRVPLKFPKLVAPEGIFVIVRYEVYGPMAILFEHCENIAVSNVRLFSHGGMGIHITQTDGIRIDRVRVAPRDAKTWMSITADAIHLKSNRGRIDITHCEFEKMGDDAVNVNQGYWVVTQKPDAKTVRVKYGYELDHLPAQLLPREGDSAQFPAEDNWLRPAFLLKIAQIIPEHETRTALIRFEEDLPSHVTTGIPLANASSNPVITIKNCTVRNNRARGFLIKTDRALIENCTFESITLPAILLENDITRWFEGVAVRDLEIKNCTFKNCDFWNQGRAAILDAPAFPPTAPAQGHINTRAKIENCSFKDCGKDPIQLRHTQTVETLKNKFL